MSNHSAPNGLNGLIDQIGGTLPEHLLAALSHQAQISASSTPAKEEQRLLQISKQLEQDRLDLQAEWDILQHTPSPAGVWSHVQQLYAKSEENK